jgi:hypothetical protein
MKLSILLGVLAWPLMAPASPISPALMGIDTKNPHPAPADLQYSTYRKWARPLLRPDGHHDFTSAFTGLVFEWYEEEKDRGLPPDVFADPGRIHVNVGRPLEQTIELEEAGEIEVGNTVGAEVYAEMEGSPDQALAAMLFRWGKPVGAEAGKTYPPDAQFARRVEYWAPNPAWGEGAYANLTLRRDGGIVKDLADRYVLLVRGNAEEGYDVLMQFILPGGMTTTKQVFAIAIIRPLGGGKVSYKISTRYQGQSYKVLGNVSIGRAQIGFNAEKVRAVQKEYGQMLQDLRQTGKIRERKTDIEFGR